MGEPSGNVLEIVAAQELDQRFLASEDNADDQAAVHVEVGEKPDHAEDLDAQAVGLV